MEAHLGQDALGVLELQDPMIEEIIGSCSACVQRSVCQIVGLVEVLYRVQNAEEPADVVGRLLREIDADLRAVGEPHDQLDGGLLVERRAGVERDGFLQGLGAVVVEERTGVCRLDERLRVELIEAQAGLEERLHRHSPKTTGFGSGWILDEDGERSRDVEVAGQAFAFSEGENSDARVLLQIGSKRSGSRREHVVADGLLGESEVHDSRPELRTNVGACIRVTQCALAGLHSTAFGVQGLEEHLALGSP